MKTLATLLLMILAVTGFAISTNAGPYKIDLRTDPAVVPVGRAKLLIAVTDASGKPLSGLEVKALVQMPSMPMGERAASASPGDKPGEYVVPAVFGMAGNYSAAVTISGPEGTGTATVALSTGGSGGGSFPWITALITVVVVAGWDFWFGRWRELASGSI